MILRWAPPLAPRPRLALALGLAGVVVALGGLDYLSGHELSFYVFYFLPIGAAAYWLGLAAACAFTGLSTATWALAEAATYEYRSAAALAWNTGVRLISFVIIGAAIARISALLARERALSRSLQAAISEVKQLRGLLPLCASCKKIRDDAGAWREIDVYLRDHADAQISHGLCPGCAATFLREAGLGDDDEGPPP